MNDEVTQDSPPEDLEDATPDDTLAVLQSLAHRGMSVGVTLTVGGILVSGNLLGGQHYFHRMAIELAASDTTGAGSVTGLVEALRNTAARYADAYADNPEGSEAPYEGLYMTHVHLGEVSIIAPGQPPIDVSLWRGRLDAVDGWSLVTLSRP